MPHKENPCEINIRTLTEQGCCHLSKVLYPTGGQRITRRETANSASNGEGTIKSPSILFYKTRVHNEGANEPNKQL